MHGDLIHLPPSELHALTSPWPFSVWGIDIIGKISPKSSSGHEFILVAIDYFTKWVEATSYAKLNAAKVATFIISHIICRYGVSHEFILDRGVRYDKGGHFGHIPYHLLLTFLFFIFFTVASPLSLTRAFWPIFSLIALLTFSYLG